MSATPDIRVTSCAGCARTVTLIGTGTVSKDFDWRCPYPDCLLRGVQQTAMQIRGPIDTVYAGMPKRWLADS